jgi:hypothetical protein
MVKHGRGSEEDRGEPSAVAPEQNRALGRYIVIWTTNPEQEWEDRPHTLKTSGGNQCNVRVLSHIRS